MTDRVRGTGRLIPKFLLEMNEEYQNDGMNEFQVLHTLTLSPSAVPHILRSETVVSTVSSPSLLSSLAHNLHTNSSRCELNEF